MPNVILNYVFVGVVLFSIMCIIAVINSYLTKKNAIKEYEVDIAHTDPEADISVALEAFINECFLEYQLLVLIPKQELYIDSNREKEICRDLSSKVAKYISPHFVNRISQRYNKDTIHEIIADKIFITVTNYVVSHNATIKSNP